MAELGVMPVVAFLAVSSLALMVVLVAGGRRTRLDQRLKEFSKPNDPAAPPDAVVDFARANQESEVTRVQPGRARSCSQRPPG